MLLIYILLLFEYDFAFWKYVELKTLSVISASDYS